MKKQKQNKKQKITTRIYWAFKLILLLKQSPHNRQQVVSRHHSQTLTAKGLSSDRSPDFTPVDFSLIKT